MKEKQFFSEIVASGHVWVAMNDGAVLSFGTGACDTEVPVWENRANVEQFLFRTRCNAEFHPVQVPLELFRASWLAEAGMNIQGLIIDPDGMKNRELVLSREEFITSVWH